jgi:hypothetical protein
MDDKIYAAHLLGMWKEMTRPRVRPGRYITIHEPGEPDSGIRQQVWFDDEDEAASPSEVVLCGVPTWSVEAST